MENKKTLTNKKKIYLLINIYFSFPLSYICQSTYWDNGGMKSLFETMFRCVDVIISLKTHLINNMVNPHV
jgi:hypothetical protein